MDESITPILPTGVRLLTVISVPRADTVNCGKCGTTKKPGSACAGCGDES